MPRDTVFLFKMTGKYETAKEKQIQNINTILFYMEEQHGVVDRMTNQPVHVSILVICN